LLLQHRSHLQKEELTRLIIRGNFKMYKTLKEIHRKGIFIGRKSFRNGGKDIFRKRRILKVILKSLGML